MADRGANTYILNNRSNFIDFTESRERIAGVGGPTYLLGTGTAMIKAKKSDSGTITITLNDVVLMPDSSYNLFSYKKLFKSSGS